MFTAKYKTYGNSIIYFEEKFKEHITSNDIKFMDSKNIHIRFILNYNSNILLPLPDIYLSKEAPELSAVQVKNIEIKTLQITKRIDDIKRLVKNV